MYNKICSFEMKTRIYKGSLPIYLTLTITINKLINRDGENEKKAFQYFIFHLTRPPQELSQTI